MAMPARVTAVYIKTQTNSESSKRVKSSLLLMKNRNVKNKKDKFIMFITWSTSRLIYCVVYSIVLFIVCAV